MNYLRLFASRSCCFVSSSAGQNARQAVIAFMARVLVNIAGVTVASEFAGKRRGERVAFSATDRIAHRVAIMQDCVVPGR